MELQKSTAPKAIVTGVLGLGGSAMADYLLTHTDCEIIGTHRDLSMPSSLNPRVKFRFLNISDRWTISDLIQREKPDYFFNFAGSTSPNQSLENPELYFEANSSAVLCQLQLIRTHVPHCKYFNAGSCLELEAAKNPYTASKAAARLFIDLYRREFGLWAVQHWLYPYEGVNRSESFVSRKITKKVAEIKKALDSNQPFEPLELGNLDIPRTWGDAECFVEGIFKSMEREQPKDYIFSAQESKTVRDFVEEAFNVAGILGIWQKFGENCSQENFILADERGWAVKKECVLVKVNPALQRKEENLPVVGNINEVFVDLNWQNTTSFKDLVRKMVVADLEELEKSS